MSEYYRSEDLKKFGQIGRHGKAQADSFFTYYNQITGQDGAYLAELLIRKGYEVHGIIRRSSSFNTGRIDHLYRDRHDEEVRLFLHHGDLSDGTGLARLLNEIAPDEIYNLGAQSHVRVSFDEPEYTGDVVGLGTQRLLEIIRHTGLLDKVRYYQASSSEMFLATVQPSHHSVEAGVVPPPTVIGAPTMVFS